MGSQWRAMEILWFERLIGRGGRAVVADSSFEGGSGSWRESSMTYTTFFGLLAAERSWLTPAEVVRVVERESMEKASEIER